MASLRVVEIHEPKQPPGLRRIIVCDRGFEALAVRRRLAQLTTEPTKQRDGGRCCHRRFCQMPRRWSVTKPTRS